MQHRTTSAYVRMKANADLVGRALSMLSSDQLAQLELDAGTIANEPKTHAQGLYELQQIMRERRRRKDRLVHPLDPGHVEGV